MLLPKPRLWTLPVENDTEQVENKTIKANFIFRSKLDSNERWLLEVQFEI